MIKIRKSNERGQANQGWLRSFHTFSFANYFDKNHMNFGNLRVINEDYIAPAAGFGKHPHHDMEIITYVISGALKHQDSMGNSSIILPGEVQTMAAGTGVSHSEFNPSATAETHLLQIWITPNITKITPTYGQKSFAEELKKGEFVLVVSGLGRNGSIKINQDTEIFAAKFSAENKKIYKIKPQRKIWLQVISGKILANGSSLENGDAAAFEDELQLEIFVQKDCEILLFDL